MNPESAFKPRTNDPPAGSDPVDATRRALERARELAARVDLRWLHPLPTDDGWTLAPDALRLLTSLIVVLQPRHILEFGSGLSTRVLARESARQRSGGRVSSIDHDPEFGPAAAQAFLPELEGYEQVRWQIAPLVARECGGKFVPVYLLEPSRLACSAPAELIVIDGPPAVLGGREGVLYQAMAFAKPGTLVLLDDADRPEERVAVENWKDNLGAAVEIIPLRGFVRGLVAAIIRVPVPTQELLAHRLKQTRREVEFFVGAEQTILVAGEEWWRAQVAAGRRSLPFLEDHGQYYGPPPDDATAIRELLRLRGSGATLFALGWPAFWWRDYYSEFCRYLQSQFRCLLRNDRLVLFDLRQQANDP